MKRIAMASVMCLSLLGACGDDDDDDVVVDGGTTADSSVTVDGRTADGSTATTTPIGAAGGTVNGPNGVILVVPAGALASTVNIGITEVTPTTTGIPGTHVLISKIYQFSPDGTTFTTPATLTIPYVPSLIPGGATVFRFGRTSNTGTNFMTVPATRNTTNNTLTGAITGFSDWCDLVLTEGG